MGNILILDNVLEELAKAGDAPGYLFGEKDLLHSPDNKGHFNDYDLIFHFKKADSKPSLKKSLVEKISLIIPVLPVKSDYKDTLNNLRTQYLNNPRFNIIGLNAHPELELYEGNVLPQGVGSLVLKKYKRAGFKDLLGCFEEVDASKLNGEIQEKIKSIEEQFQH